MALTPQQLQALYQAEAQGQQSAFAAATPGMDQNERNQWINMYGPGGTNYGDFKNWYGQRANQQVLNANPYSASVGGAGAGWMANPASDPSAGKNPYGNLPTNGSWDVNAKYGQPIPTTGTTNPYSLTMPTSGSPDTPTGFSNPYNPAPAGPPMVDTRTNPQLPATGRVSVTQNQLTGVHAGDVPNSNPYAPNVQLGTPPTAPTASTKPYAVSRTTPTTPPVTNTVPTVPNRTPVTNTRLATPQGRAGWGRGWNV